MGTMSTNGAIWDLLAERWRKTIKAKALSANTERGYLYTARRWSAWLVEHGYDVEPREVRADHIDDFIANIIEATSAANGAHHYRNLRVYFAWLVKRKEITGGNPMAETEPPTVPDKLIPVLTDDEYDGLFGACAGRDFLSVRDTAIMLLFRDTGCRVSEQGTLDKNDIDLVKRRFKVLGKGGRERWVGFGSDAALALARYLKMWPKYATSDSTALWLNRWGRPISVDGIKCMLTRRGRQAGIAQPVHAHRFRHDFTHRWKRAGGSDEGLMYIGGWMSMKMVHHYGRAARAERALAEQDRLALADRAS
jgi:site-specific recombinase XerD